MNELNFRDFFSNGGIFDTLKEFIGIEDVESTPKLMRKQHKIDAPRFKIVDGRKVLATTGQPLRPNSDLVSGEYNLEVLSELIHEAKRRNLPIQDIKNLAAIAFQETKFGKTDGNVGHVLPQKGVKGDNAYEDLVSVYINKMGEADRLGIKDDALRLQTYNGLGKVRPTTEQDYHGFKMSKIYGVPVPKEGINLKNNPLYGKQIIDLRDNVLEVNTEYLNHFNNIYNSETLIYGNKQSNAVRTPLLSKFEVGGEFRNGGQYDAVINAAEQKYRLPAGLLHGVARTESQYNPNTYNEKSKAAGMFQFVPGTAREFGIDPYDVNQAADAAGKYLSQLIKQTGSVEDALRAYNFGIGNVQKWKQGKKALPLETQQYVGKVLGGSTAPSIGGGLGKYFNQIEQDLSWRSRQIDEELENEEIHQYSQEEAIANNTEEEDEETATEEQPQVTQDEYVPLNELSKLMTASRRNDFLDIIFANTTPSIEEDSYQYYS